MKTKKGERSLQTELGTKQLIARFLWNLHWLLIPYLLWLLLNIIITELPLIISVLFWDGDQEGRFLWNRPSMNPLDALADDQGDGD
jgi:hypothetical protein